MLPKNTFVLREKVMKQWHRVGFRHMYSLTNNFAVCSDSNGDRKSNAS